MRTDTLIQHDGMEALVKKLGLVEAERFIALLLREPFDYTEWRKKLWQDVSAEEVLAEAKAFESRQEGNNSA